VSRAIDQRKLSNWYNFQARFYHLWRDDYDNPLIERVAAGLAPAERPATVLDAGCGTGLFTIGLARLRKHWNVEGIDAAAGMLAVAARQARRFGLENAVFRQGDVTALPHPTGTFDGIVAAGLFPNLNEWSEALGELFRVLAPGGRLAVVELDRNTMSATLRAFVRVMIFGYRVISTVVPRFRFAERWNVQASTVDAELLAAEARTAGFIETVPAHQGSWLVLWFEKGAP